MTTPRLKDGDRFRVPGVQNDYNYGTVIWAGQKSYKIEWDNFPGNIMPYGVEEIDDKAELYLPQGNLPLHPHFQTAVKIPSAIDFIPITIKIDEEKRSECRHEFVDYVGFTEHYRYCKHCDTKE